MGSASLKVNEPSMEDILASIRRIIADDQEAMHEPDSAETASAPLRNVLDLAERHRPSAIYPDPITSEDELPGLSSSRNDHFQADGKLPPFATSFEVDLPDPRPATGSKPVPAEPQPARGSQVESLLSTEACAAISSSFDRLGSAILPSQPVTVEGLMKEMLRPMLKQWLDQNLPAIVERLVQAEIERVTRR